ncbi:MAG: Rpn family recombination-promoting nuclease/putative transposase [Verrucomicrobiota bacterium]
MRFINPRTDLAFKKIFGSEGSKPILISFLNAMLHAGEPEIVDLEILDPYSIPRLEGMKDSYLDVRSQLRSGETVLIEMQVLNVAGFEKRVLYNAAKEYANQLERGTDYESLNPVIALTITDFILFPEPDMQNRVISRFALIEKEEFIEYPNGDVELVFVELPKFQVAEADLHSLTEKWLYFLCTAPDVSAVPKTLEEVDEIQEAFEIAEFAKLSREEERALEKKAQWVADQKRFQKGLAEMEQALGTMKQQVEDEKQRAEDEKQRAEDEKQRADKLAQRLREAGMDPDEM